MRYSRLRQGCGQHESKGLETYRIKRVQNATAHAYIMPPTPSRFDTGDK